MITIIKMDVLSVVQLFAQNLNNEYDYGLPGNWSHGKINLMENNSLSKDNFFPKLGLQLIGWFNSIPSQ